MPELPEVQAHAERLTEGFAGAVLTRVEPLSFTALKTAVPAADVAVGTALDRVGRRGKHLLLHFGPWTYVVHLMQGGRLEPDTKRSKRPRGGVLRWVLGEDALLLTEAGTERRAGVWVTEDDPLAQPPLDDLGPEADALDTAGWGALLADQRGRVHNVLRDQRVVAGIGRRLASEVVWRARLSPFAIAGRLTDEEVARLAAAVGTAIAEGLAADRGRARMSASKDRPGGVYHRVGEACPVCGDTVRAVEYRSYEIDYCPTCQTDGRVLADNTTSRFLK